jgi:hypothetical protein
MHAILAQRWQDSNNLFNSSFIDSELDFILYDETDAPVQEGKIKFKTNFKNKRVRNILNNYEFTSANHFVKTNNFIDSAFADLGFDYERGLDIQ